MAPRAGDVAHHDTATFASVDHPPVDLDLLDGAAEIAAEAAAFVADRFRADDMTIELKTDGTEVTDVDRGVALETDVQKTAIKTVTGYTLPNPTVLCFTAVLFLLP